MDLPQASWRKSSRSNSGGNCVEVGFGRDGARAVRDTKDRAAGHFTTTGAQWTSFLTAVKTGRYDT
ncbi:DUF397 domain-containing protein [Saccharopolyspora sp. CA-218241]|uniref:DUF397 domain-containing protein n=1 Tax=Saccharopolyspora sp. CA-218241 TaxID=3240027 RepID=UPI003D954917